MPEFHANGMVPWPYFNGGCKQEQLPVDRNLQPFGTPCSEGGSIAVESRALKTGAKNCMVFYEPKQDVRKLAKLNLAAEPSGGAYRACVKEREKHILGTVMYCIGSEAHEIPIKLFEIASCIVYQAPFSLNHFPVYGVAVVPQMARSPLNPPDSWSQVTYSSVTARRGALFEKLVEVRLEADSRPSGVLQLCVVVNSPVKVPVA